MHIRKKTNDKGETRVILKLDPALAPIKVADFAHWRRTSRDCGAGEIHQAFTSAVAARCLRRHPAALENSTHVRMRLARPFCVTVDHQSLEDEAVTGRDRDTWEQERIKVSDLQEHLSKSLKT